MSDRLRPNPARFRTTNLRRYNQALKARGALMIWLERDLQWSGLASGKHVRPSLFSGAAIQFCLTIKALFGLALRQAMGMVESLLKFAGLSWLVPDYNQVCRRQNRLRVRIPYRPAAQGRYLLVDGTGMKMIFEGEWKRKDHDSEYRRQWRRLHIRIDAQKLEIRAIEVTPNSVGDASVLPTLLGQIDPHEGLLSFSGDGAYGPKACREAIALCQVQVIIPVRKNLRKPWKENRPRASVRNEILRGTQRLGRAICKCWSGYQRRSLVETKMRCVKLMGKQVMARDFDRQVA